MWRPALRISLLLLLILMVAVGWTFLPKRLRVPPGPDYPTPAHSAPAALEIRLLDSGYISGLHAFSVRGGSLESYPSDMISVLVRHPDGVYLLDAGFGRDVERHFETASRLMQAFADVTLETPVVDHLAALGIRPSDLAGILLSHGHWDHTSGLEDLAGVPVFLHRRELESLSIDDPNSRHLASTRQELDLRVLELPDGPYLGFPASRDLFGDGSVVVVEMGGHTPGSLGLFVYLADGRRYFFTGDVSWTKEGFEWPAEKPWLLRRTVDFQPEEVRRLLVHVHHLMRQDPALVVVPAHDGRVHRQVERASGP